MDTKQFLNSIHQGENKIHFRVIKDKSINLYGAYNELETELEYYNNNGYNIYFVVNSGGTHNYDINKINAVFIDYDAGKDKNKKYYPINIVNKFKESCLSNIHNFKFRPSFIVETRNGYHIYWLVNNDATIEDFLQCQNFLINYFKSDEKVKTQERVMRLPNYFWMKDVDNPYMCEIKENNNVRYDIKEINEYLKDKISVNINGCNGEGINVRDKDSTKDNYLNHGLISPHTENIKQLKLGNVKYFRDIIKPEHMIFNTYDQIYDYLKKQDLCLFLGLPQRFNCIFHKDNNPSANIYQDPRNGYYWYKCFSPDCNRVRDIISLVEYFQKVITPKALKFLCDVYDVEYIETSWQREQKAILEENKRLLKDVERLQIIAPETYKRIKNHIQDLYIINDIAKDYVIADKYSTIDNKAMFWASLKKIARMCNKNSPQVLTDYIGLFTYLGLLEKLSQDKIPEEIYKVAEDCASKIKNQIVAKMKDKDIYTEEEIEEIIKGLKVPTLNFYNVPSYNETILSFTEKKSIEFKQKGFTMKGWGREMLYRGLGKEEADRVFPQMKDVALSEFSENTTYEIETSILKLIDKKGYTTEKEAINNTYLHFKNLKKEFRYKQKQIKRIIPEIIDKYDLIKIKADKTLKEKFKIEGNGYPVIITRNNK